MRTAKNAKFAKTERGETVGRLLADYAWNSINLDNVSVTSLATFAKIHCDRNDCALYDATGDGI